MSIILYEKAIEKYEITYYNYSTKLKEKKSMKVLTYTGPRALEVNDAASKALKPDHVRIATMYTGISHGTEMNIYRGDAPQWTKVQDPKTRLFEEPAEGQNAWTYPISSNQDGVWWMGYAAVGKVIEIGAEVKDIAVGDVVYVVAPHESEIVAWEGSCTKLPDGIDYRTGIFLNNLNTAFNGILDSRIKLGDYVVVSGLGVLGQLIAQLAKKSGAIVIGIDGYDLRLNKAKELGAIDYAFKAGKGTAEKVKELTDYRGADLVIEASGSTRGLQEAIRMAAYDGNVTCISWYHGPYDVLDFSGEFHHNRVTIRTSHTCAIDKAISNTWDMKRRNETCVKLLSELKLSDLITTQIDFNDAPKAYEQIDKHGEQVIQTILDYTKINEEIL